MIPRHEKHDSARNTATQLPSMGVIGKTNALSPAYAGGQVSSGLQFYGAAIGIALCIGAGVLAWKRFRR